MVFLTAMLSNLVVWHGCFPLISGKEHPSVTVPESCQILCKSEMMMMTADSFLVACDRAEFGSPAVSGSIYVTGISNWSKKDVLWFVHLVI